MTVVAVVMSAWACDAAWCQVPGDQDAGPPVVPEEMIEEAIAKIENGDLQEASDLVRRVKFLKPTMPKILLAEGLLTAAQHRDIEAMRLLEAYNNPKDEMGVIRTVNDYRGYLAVGKIYRDSLMHRQAVPPLEMAFALAPLEKDGKALRAEIAVDLALVFYRLQRKEKAVEMAKEARRLAPNDAGVLLRLGQVAASTGEYETASESAEGAIGLLVAELQISPFKREAHIQLRECYQLVMGLKGQKQQEKPDDGTVYYEMAVVAREAAEVEKRLGLLDAFEYVEQGRAKEPDNAEWALFAARLQAELGALDEALQSIDRVLQSHPDHPEATRLRDSLTPAGVRSKKP